MKVKINVSWVRIKWIWAASQIPQEPVSILSAGLNLEKFNTILSGTNHIWAAA